MFIYETTFGGANTQFKLLLHSENRDQSSFQCRVFTMISLYVLIFSLILGAQCDVDNVSTPPPPVGDILGGTKADRVALFEKFLNSGRPEQMVAYRDDNPILKEVLKVFNKTIQTHVNGYLAHKSMLISSDKECDRKAIDKADATMKKAFDSTTECLINFRQKIRAEVSSSITDTREVPDDQRASLILPVDECFEKMKIDTFEEFGKNTAEHIVCSKKIKN